MNLITDAWVPVIRKDGTKEKIAPHQITENLDSNPIVSIDSPRPDFNGALLQFFIGLMQTAFAPKRESGWLNRIDSPPSPEELRKSFSKFEHAFDLDGDGKRFMQEEGLSSSERVNEWPVSFLLIGMPTEQTVKDNKDHFVKQGNSDRLCTQCSATALFCMQTNAPSGGRGHLTSVRGGGPLTTVILGKNLWETVWFNTTCDVERKQPPEEKIFPWLAALRTSENGMITTSDDIDPLQLFWAMPRRILLDFNENGDGKCSVCGDGSKGTVKSFWTKGYGIKYDGVHIHPLSPYYYKDNLPLPLHLKEKAGYRHWLGFILSKKDNANGRPLLDPAKTVTDFLNSGRGERNFTLSAFGYEMDNMKAVCWHESRMPVLHLSENIKNDFENAVEKFILAAEQVAGNIVGAIKEAWFKRKKDAKGDFSFLKRRFWEETEVDFNQTALETRKLLEAGKSLEEIKKNWLKTISDKALEIFDSAALAGPIEDGDPARVARARRNLDRYNRDRKIKKILEIGLDELPEDSG